MPFVIGIQKYLYHKGPNNHPYPSICCRVRGKFSNKGPCQISAPLSRKELYIEMILQVYLVKYGAKNNHSDVVT